MKRYASGPRAAVTLLLVGVLSIVAFAAPAAAAAIATTTEAEPNNTAPTATLLTLDGGRAIGSGAILAGDTDYWQIGGVPAGARIWVYIDTGGVQAPAATSRDSLMKLYASDGTTLIEADDDDGTANGLDGILDATAGPSLGSAIAGRVLPAGGTYYVRLDGIDATAVISPYTLYVVVSTVAQAAPESEPNNSAVAVAAQPVLSGSTTLAVRDAAIGAAGDQDYYAVSLTAGDILIMMADADPARSGNGIDVVIELLGTDGTSVLLTCDESVTGSVNDPAAEACGFQVQSTGVYFVRVRAFNPSATGAYSLLVAAMGAGSVSITYTLDIDASGAPTRYDALTDGLLVYRHLTGLSGTALTQGLMSANATRTSAQINTYLTGMHSTLDVDGNGTPSAATDGVLIVRYLLGLRGNALIQGAVGAGATRSSAAAIEAYLGNLVVP